VIDADAGRHVICRAATIVLAYHDGSTARREGAEQTLEAVSERQPACSCLLRIQTV
jgi:hypothetical protein